MEPGYLIDTNVIIDNFGNRLPKKAKEFLNSFEPVISAVTKVEVAECHGRATNTLICFYGYCFILPITESAIEKKLSS